MEDIFLAGVTRIDRRWNGDGAFNTPRRQIVRERESGLAGRYCSRDGSRAIKPRGSRQRSDTS